jgi:putative ABC transport system substrate-binding protein
MRRREFIAGLGSAAAWPLAARAQSIPVVGYLDPGSPQTRREQISDFLRGLSEGGFVEGQNVVIERRWAEGQYDRLPKLAADLVRRRVAVIVAATTPGALAAKGATTTIPIVFGLGADPVKLGLVASLNRPGANVTGASSLTNDLTAKNLGLLIKLVPSGALVAMLVNPTNPNAEIDTEAAQAAARTLGVRMLMLNASTEDEIEAAFATLARHGATALLVGSDASFAAGARGQLVTLATRHKVPTIYDRSDFTVAGGLMSYGAVDLIYREAGIYAGRVLKGAKPADLPIKQPTRFELVINLKAAKAIGLTIPETLLATADEVIQ